MQRSTLIATIEALLFATPEPLTIHRLSELLGLDERSVTCLIGELQRELADNKRGVLVLETATGFRLTSNPQYVEFVTKLLSQPASPLSNATLETLAIIAYKQPITRAEIEAIRGVNSDGAVSRLVDRGLISDIGRKEVAGRPVLFATTSLFLDYFGLKRLDELPVLEGDEPVPQEGMLFRQRLGTTIQEAAPPEELLVLVQDE